MKIQKSIKKNAILNIIKTVCGVVFPLVTFPYATRVLGAENYGLYSFSTSIISYLTLVAGFGFATYATREGARIRNKENELHIFINEIFTLNIITTCLAYIILAFIIAFWNKLEIYSGCILVLSLSIFFTTIGTDWINIIFEDYEYITKRYIVCYLIQIMLLFLIVRGKNDVIQYAAVSVFSAVFANIINIIYLKRKYNISAKIKFDKQIFYHFIPAFIFFANSIVTVIYINSDITILGILKEDYSVGIYSVASRIYLLAKQLISAITVVIIPRMSALVAKNDDKSIAKVYSGALKTVILIVIPCVTGLFLESHNVVSLLSGNEYIDATSPLQILSIALIFATLGNVFINVILIPFKREKIVLIITTLSASVNIILNYLFIPSYSYNATATTTLIAEIIVFIIGFIEARKLQKIKVWREFIISIIGGFLVFVCCSSCSIVLYNYILQLFVSIITSVLLYFVLLILAKDNVFYDFFIKLLKIKNNFIKRKT